MAMRTQHGVFYSEAEAAEMTGLTGEEVAGAVDALVGMGHAFTAKEGKTMRPMLSADDVREVIVTAGRIKTQEEHEARIGREEEMIDLYREEVATTKAAYAARVSADAVAENGIRMMLEVMSSQAEAMKDVAVALREGTACEKEAREKTVARAYSQGYEAGLAAAKADDRRREAMPVVTTPAGEGPPRLPTDAADALPRLGTEEDHDRLLVVDLDDSTPGRRVISAPGRTFEQSQVIAPVFAAGAALVRVAIKIANAHGYNLCYRAELLDALKAAKVVPADAR